MRLITRRDMAATAAKRFEEWTDGRISTRGEKVLRSLRQLGPSPDPDAVEALWKGATYVGSCTECGVVPEELVEFGDLSDAESTIVVCNQCLLKAMMLIEP